MSTISNEILETAMKSWLFEIKKQQMSNATFLKLIRHKELYIYPQLGNKPISKIELADMQHLFIDILHNEKNLSFATIYKCKCLLKNFFDYCIQLNYIQSNPIADSFSEMSNKRQFKRDLETKDYQSIIDGISSSRFWKPFCLTMLFARIRLSEILALTWKDIDFERKLIIVSKYVSPPTVGEINTHITSIRELPITNELVDVLKVHKRYREREQREKKNRYSYVSDSDLVFGNDESEIRSYSGLSHNFKKYLMNRGLPYRNITLHSLRSFNKEQQKRNRRTHKSSMSNIPCNIGIDTKDKEKRGVYI